VKSAQMHPLAQLARLCFILILGLAAPAVLNAHSAFIMLPLFINVPRAPQITTLMGILVEQIAKPFLIVINQMVVMFRGLTATPAIYNAENAVVVIQVLALNVMMDPT